MVTAQNKNGGGHLGHLLGSSVSGHQTESLDSDGRCGVLTKITINSGVNSFLRRDEKAINSGVKFPEHHACVF